jgi:succinyl-CoA synthetase beta subunit
MPMKLYEYEGKSLFAARGIPVPMGFVAESPEEAKVQAGKIGRPVVIKSQILQGGRGKAGGIKFANTPEEASIISQDIIGAKLKSEQIKKILIEEKLDIAKEYYLSITIDAPSASPIIIASSAGGVDIEEIAQQSPEKIVMEKVNIFRGLLPYQARRVCYKMGLAGVEAIKIADVIVRLYQIFRQYDAELVEINPLVITGDGQIIAADAKVNIYDNALYRQKQFTRKREHFEREEEFQAAEIGLGYIKLEGNIGICCAGAGLTMMTLDLINYHGGRAANFLEFGGAQYKNAYNALNLVLQDPAVKVVLINVFGLIARADVISQGLAEAVKSLKPSVPLVASIRGTGEEEGHRILKEEIGLTAFKDAEEAVKEAIKIAGGGSCGNLAC